MAAKSFSIPESEAGSTTVGLGAIVINRATNASALWKLGLAVAVRSRIEEREGLDRAF